MAQKTNIQIHRIILGTTTQYNLSMLNVMFDASLKKANDLWKKHCGFTIDSVGGGSSTCGPTDPCITTLNIKGNPQMARYNQIFFSWKDLIGNPTINIFVAPAAKFAESPTTFGTTVTFGTPNNFGIFIWLTLDAITGQDPYILAHEIGHALFVKNFTQNRFFHSTNKRNLMFRIVPRVDPLITARQCQLARMSNLLF